MSDRIGSRPMGPPHLPAPSADPAETVRSNSGEASLGAETQSPADAYESPPNSTMQAQLQTRLQALAGKGAPAKVQFSSADMAYLAQTFASLVAQNPNADRLKRARLFARAILKRSRVRQMFAGVSDAEMEHMCEAIADVLDGSPVFGQLVDNVTEGTSKLSG
jgi:hypothetical protein